MRSVKISVGAVALIIVLGAAGAYLYFFSGLRSTPKPLALASASPATGTSSKTSLVGNWTIASGSTAEYRATEQFAGQTSSHQAVASTTSLSGGLKINGSGSALSASQVKVTVQLTNLKSQDTVPVPGLDVANRDSIVQRTLDTATYPTATLTSDSIQLPANAAGGSRVTIPIQGQLTIHGVTKTVSFPLEAQLGGGKVEVLGTIPVNMSDYGVRAPNLPLVAVQPQLQLQFQAFFARQAT